MTYREMINAVLRRLRQNTINVIWDGDLEDATNVSAYQKLIGDFVEEVRKEVENSWNWRALFDTDTDSISGPITTPSRTIYASNFTLNISDPGLFKLVQIVHTDTGQPLIELSYAEMRKLHLANTSNVPGRPMYYSISDRTDNYLGNTVQVYPPADQEYEFESLMFTGEDPLTESQDITSLPSHVIILGAWARAIAERGEDGGSLSDMVFGQYSNALSDEIQKDALHSGQELIWYVS